MKKILKSIQYFFWLLAGSDIKILEKTPTDQNRHANVGLAIFTTTLVAFVTGCLAGLQFAPKTEYKWGLALFFGGLWSLLVFTIDRNMVLTLKKNPKLKKQKLIKPFLYRLFLSGLISFFISIPLELWIFKDEIKEQMKKDDDKKIEERKLALAGIYDLGKLSDEKREIEEDIKNLQTKLNAFEPSTPSYLASKEKAIRAGITYERYDTYYKNQVKRRKEFHKKWRNRIVFNNDGQRVRIGDLQKIEQIKYRDNNYANWKKIYVLTNTNGKETLQRNKLRIKRDSLEEIRLQIFNDYYRGVEADKKQKDSIALKKQKELSVNKGKVNTEVEDYETLTKDNSGFISQWIALNNLHIVGDEASENKKSEAFWILFFIWFIRVVFFTIELLPTLTKFTTPVGAYDWAIYEEEEKQRKLLEKRKELKLAEMDSEIEVEIEERKILKEKGLKNLESKILEDYFERQNRIATKMMEVWEKEEMEKIKESI
ncbi:DUF4407 domain-containing protein [Tenacibaculum amylolyticum]|uniref:DUF4407 domain-containing protein n=1 Tax=Tenacibaculum amylolyticum TaxID=104269 RepID=UPI003893AF3D